MLKQHGVVGQTHDTQKFMTNLILNKQEKERQKHVAIQARKARKYAKFSGNKDNFTYLSKDFIRKLKKGA